MANLILHDTTIRLIEQLKKQTPHALLLHSDQHVGLKSIALEIAGATAQLVAPDEGDTATIKVDTIRRLYEQTKGKTTKRQYFIIDDAEIMTNSAQSAFLKLLEEPTDNIVFILTSHQPEQLLI
jgi:DNA polymerase III delta prime subunit